MTDPATEAYNALMRSKEAYRARAHKLQTQLDEANRELEILRRAMRESDAPTVKANRFCKSDACAWPDCLNSGGYCTEARVGLGLAGKPL